MGASDQWQRRVGQSLRGKYTLDALIGVGGMAAVYRGRHRNGNRVAVKILHTELSASEDIKGRFLREGYVANRVEHEGTVRVLDDDLAEDGAPYLVMELLQGTDLEAHITARGGKVDAHEIVPMVCQLLEVLAAAHAEGIVHRDIKPENLFVTSAGRIKVLDFGIARLADSSRQATRTGGVMGTPVYMAPEQARGETKLIDGQTDVWAAAAVLFRALTGRFVFEAATPEMVMVAAAIETAPKIEQIVPSIDRNLAAVVNRGLARSKEERWKSANEMLAALRSPSARPASSIAETVAPATPIMANAPGVLGANRTMPTPSNLPQRAYPATAVSGAPPAPHPYAGATTAGVSSSRSASAPPNKSGALLAAGAVVGVLVLGGGGVAVWKLQSPTVGQVPSAQGLSPAAPPSAAAGATPAEPTSATAVTSSGPTGVPAPTETSVAAASTPTSRSPKAGEKPASPVKPNATASVPPKPVASVCEPKKVLTPDGTWQWKMECKTP